MRCLIIFGSPRKNGNTASLLKPVMDELEAGGAELIYRDVYDSRIAGCQACLMCQNDMEHINCVINDDMQDILKVIPTVDAILIAAPVYAWSVPAPVKSVIDRLIYSTCRYYGKDPHGPALMKNKKLYLLTTCGYPVEKGSDLYEEAMRRYCKHCGLTFGGIITERQRNLQEQFMDQDKEQRARTFAKSILQSIKS